MIFIFLEFVGAIEVTKTNTLQLVGQQPDELQTSNERAKQLEKTLKQSQSVEFVCKRKSKNFVFACASEIEWKNRQVRKRKCRNGQGILVAIEPSKTWCFFSTLFS